MRLLAALGALSLAFAASPAFSRAYTVEDLLATESIDGAVIAPDGGWAVIARSRPWTAAPRFDHAGRTELTLGRLDVIDLRRPAPALPLFPQEADAGYSPGPISPSGRYMLVFRLQDHVWSAGVVTVPLGKVRWLDATPKHPVYGRVAQWRSDDELLLIVRPTGDAPRQLRLGWQASQLLPRLWAAQAGGHVPTASVVGSGKYLGRKAAPARAGLLRVDPASGQSSILARGEFLDLEVSPSGRHVALFGAAEAMQPTAGDRVTASFATRRRSLELIDLRTGVRSEPCAGCDFHLRLLSWSPRAEDLIAAKRNPGSETPDLVRISVKNLKVERLDLGGYRPTLAYTGEGAPLIAAEWLEADPIVYVQAKGAGRSDWLRLSASGPVNLTAKLTAAPRRLLSIHPGEIQLLSGGSVWNVDRDGHAVAVGGGTLTEADLPRPLGLGARFAANPNVRNAPLVARRTSAKGETLVTLSPLPRMLGQLGGCDDLLAVSTDVALVKRRSPSGVATVELLRQNSGSRPVMTINRHLAAVTPARVIPVVHEGPSGAALTSWLYLPAVRADIRHKPPLVVMPYPSAVFARPALSTLPGERRFPVHPQILVASGYAVLMPSLPFKRTAGEPIAGLADQVLAVIDKAVASGAVDGDRMALLGHSFGAYAAMASATQTDRFKAVIAIAGISDLVSYWGTMPVHYRVVPDDGPFFAAMAGLAERGHPYLQAPPWIDPDRYVRNSPLFAADQISTPMLLIHGDQDEVGFNQSEEMFAALYRQGKNAKFVTYWGEGHHILSPANVRDLHARVLDFLDENLAEPSPTRR